MSVKYVYTYWSIFTACFKGVFSISMKLPLYCTRPLPTIYVKLSSNHKS